MSIVESPYSFYFDPTRSRSIGLGKAFIGQPGLDPVIEANRINLTLVQEDGTEVPILPAGQPIELNSGGGFTYLGSPVQVQVEGIYSQKVLDRNGVQVYFFPSSGDVSDVVSSIASLKALSASDGDSVFVTGYYADSDGGGGHYQFDSASVVSDNGGTVIAPTAGAGRWVLSVTGTISVKQFGAVGDGAADDSAAFLAAAAITDNPLLPAGTYNVVSGNFEGVRFYSFGGVTITSNISVTVINVSSTPGVDLSKFNVESLMMTFNTTGVTPSDGAIQGIAIDQVNGFVYVSQRVDGTTNTTSERTRIHQFVLKEDGTSHAPIASSAALSACGHAQDLSIEYIDKDGAPLNLRLWTRGKATSASEDQSTGKSVCRIDITNGTNVLDMASVVDGDCENFHLFDATGGGDITEPMHKLTPTVSQDGLYLAASYVNFDNPTDRQVGVWLLSAVSALTDNAAFVADIRLNSFPIPRESRSTIQGILMDNDKNIYLASGSASWANAARIAKLTMDGRLQELVWVSQERPTASITQHELEGISFYEKDGQTFICGGNIRDDGTETKRLYGFGFGTIINQVFNQVPASGAILDLVRYTSERDIVYRDGDALSFGFFNETTSLYTQVGAFDSVGNFEVNFNLQMISANGTHVAQIETQDAVGREILELRAKTAQTDGGWINLYGDSDSVNPDRVSMGAGSTNEEIIIENGSVVIDSLAINTLAVNGNLTLAATNKLYFDGGGDTFISEASANQISLTTGGTTSFDTSTTSTRVLEGEVFLNLPVSAGTTGSLWNDSGTVKVA